MKNALYVTAVTLFLLSICVLPGLCDTYTSDPDLRVFEGYVAYVDTGRQTLRVNGVVEIDFTLSSDTQIKRDDNDIKLSDIGVGDYVSVSYYRLGTESRVSSKVIRVTLKYKGYGA